MKHRMRPLRERNLIMLDNYPQLEANLCATAAAKSTTAAAAATAAAATAAANTTTAAVTTAAAATTAAANTTTTAAAAAADAAFLSSIVVHKLASFHSDCFHVAKMQTGLRKMFQNEANELKKSSQQRHHVADRFRLLLVVMATSKK